VERFFGLAQDRWVKEMRLAGVGTRAEANQLLRRKLMPEYNRRFTVQPAQSSDAHRDLGQEHYLPAILSVQEERVVANDYTIRFRNACYQLHPPVWPGEPRSPLLPSSERPLGLITLAALTPLFRDQLRRKSDREQRMRIAGALTWGGFRGLRSDNRAVLSF